MRFVCDRNLHPVAKWLRILGLDCAYDGGASSSAVIDTAVRENRTLVTRRPIAETNCLKVFRLNSDVPSEQFREIAASHSLRKNARPFTRCLRCNTPLTRRQVLRPDGEPADVPHSVIDRRLPLYCCPTCRRTYWEGSHVERMKSKVRCVLNSDSPI